MQSGKPWSFDRGFITNISDEILTLDGSNEPTIDIRVEGEHRSDGRELTSELTRVTLRPGESRVLNWVWPTSQTDLKELRGSFSPGPGMLSISVDGIVIPRLDASRGAVWVYAYYRKPCGGKGAEHGSAQVGFPAPGTETGCCHILHFAGNRLAQPVPLATIVSSIANERTDVDPSTLLVESIGQGSFDVGTKVADSQRERTVAQMVHRRKLRNPLEL